MSCRAQCITQPRTHHLCSQHGRSRPVCRRPDRAAADEAAHHRSRPRWLSGHFHWLQVRIRARQPSLPPCPACLTRRNEPCDRQAHSLTIICSHRRQSRDRVCHHRSVATQGPRASRAAALWRLWRHAVRLARCMCRSSVCVGLLTPGRLAGDLLWVALVRLLQHGIITYTGAVRDHSRADLGLLG